MGRMRQIPDFQSYKINSPIPIFKNELEIEKYIRDAIKFIYSSLELSKKAELKKRSDEFKEILNDKTNFEFIEKKLKSIIIQLGDSAVNSRVYSTYLNQYKEPIEYTHGAIMCEINKYWLVFYTTQSLNLECLNFIIKHKDQFKGFQSEKKNILIKKVNRDLLIGSSTPIESIKENDLFQFLTIYFNQDVIEFNDTWIASIIRLVSKGGVYLSDESEKSTQILNNKRYDIDEYGNYRVFQHKRKDGILKFSTIPSILSRIATLMSEGVIKEYKSKNYFLEILYKCYSEDNFFNMDEESIKYIINLLLPHLHPLDYKRFNSIPWVIKSKEFVDFLIKNKNFYHLIPSINKFTKKFESTNLFPPSHDDDDNDNNDNDNSNKKDSAHTLKDDVIVYLNVRQRFFHFSTFELANYFHKELLECQKESENQINLNIQSINKQIEELAPFSTAPNNSNITIRSRSKIPTKNQPKKEVLEQQIAQLQSLLKNPKFSNKEIYYLLFITSLKDCDISTIENIDKVVSCDSDENNNKFQVLFQLSFIDLQPLRNGIDPDIYDYKKVGYKSEPFDEDDDYYEEDDKVNNVDGLHINNSKFIKDENSRDNLLGYLKSSGFKCFTPSIFCYLLELLLLIDTEKSNQQFEEIFKPVQTTTTTLDNNNNINETIFKLSFDLLVHLIHFVDFKKFSIILDSVCLNSKLILEMVNNGKRILNYEKNIYEFRDIKTKNYRYHIDGFFCSKIKFSDARDLLKILLYQNIVPNEISNEWIYQNLYISILQSTGVTLNGLVEINKIYECNQIHFPYASPSHLNYILDFSTFGNNNNNINKIYYYDYNNNHNNNNNNNNNSNNDKDNIKNIISNFVLFYWFYLLDWKLSRIFVREFSNGGFKDFSSSRLSCSQTSSICRIRSKRNSNTPSLIFQSILESQKLDLLGKYILFKSYFPEERSYYYNTSGEHYQSERSRDLKVLLDEGEFELAIHHLQMVTTKIIAEFQPGMVSKLFSFITLEQIIQLIKLTTINNIESTSPTTSSSSKETTTTTTSINTTTTSSTTATITQQQPLLKMWYGTDVVKCKDWILLQAISFSRLDIVDLLLVKDFEYSTLPSTAEFLTSYRLLKVLFSPHCDIKTLEYFLNFSNGIIIPTIKKFLVDDNYDTQNKNDTFQVIRYGIGIFELLRAYIPSLVFSDYLIEKLIENRRFETLQYYMEIEFLKNEDLSNQQKEQLKYENNLKHLDWVNNLNFKKRVYKRNPPTFTATSTTTPLLQTRSGRTIIPIKK
ncbi:hypothetical protein ACTFIV_001111 [Dictyostelium citrinum]